jgi:hypothetical protein
MRLPPEVMVAEPFVKWGLSAKAGRVAAKKTPIVASVAKNRVRLISGSSVRRSSRKTVAAKREKEKDIGDAADA